MVQMGVVANCTLLPVTACPPGAKAVHDRGARWAQCAGPTLRFDDLTSIVPIDPFTGTPGMPGAAGYAQLASHYHDSRLTWTNWDVINGVLWGDTISDPKQVSVFAAPAATYGTLQALVLTLACVLQVVSSRHGLLSSMSRVSRGRVCRLFA